MTRAELALFERQEQAERRKDLAFFALAAGVSLALALALIALFTVILSGNTHRLAATSGLAAACGLGCWHASKKWAPMTSSCVLSQPGSACQTEPRRFADAFQDRLD